MQAWFWLLIALVALAGSCAAMAAGSGTAVNGTGNGRITVVYTVTGDGTADLTFDTFANGNSSAARIAGQPLPWRKTITASGRFNTYSVTATGSTGSPVACTITVGGTVLSRHSASGQFATADCNATDS